MSHKYPKMYIVRPQFFIPIITVLGTRASGNTLTVRKRLEVVRSQNMDIENFENEAYSTSREVLQELRPGVGQFTEAIKRIDNSIEQLNKVKASLLKSGNNYRLANDKAQDLIHQEADQGQPHHEKEVRGSGIEGRHR